jgi:hypothetical protein
MTRRLLTADSFGFTVVASEQQDDWTRARDFERYATTVAAFIRLAMIRLMLRRLTRSTLCP